MRRLAIILGWVAAGALIALAALPWWLGFVIKGVGARYGAHYARYERVGYARFALHDVVVTQPSVKVRVARAETETPLLWLFHRATGKPAAIVATTWAVEVKPREGTVAPTGKSGAMPTRAILFRVARVLERWVPRAEVGAGNVSWPGAGLQFAGAEWKERTLVARALRYGKWAGDVEVTFTREGEILLAAKPVGDEPWRIALKSAGDKISGELRAWEQMASLTATLPEQGWMPAAVDVAAKAWAIPGRNLKLGEAYATVRGDARIAWSAGKFEATADVAGEVAKGKKAPPLTAKLRARGDAETVVVEALALEIPGATAKLSDPITISRGRTDAARVAHFTLEMDLAKQPWIESARGRVSGKAEVNSASEGVPRIDATLEARDLAVGEWALAQLRTVASLDWPRLSVKEAVVSFAEGGQLALRGGWDFRSNEIIEASAEGVIRPSVFKPWLPAGVDFESLTLAAKAHGPMATLQHEGTARVTTLQLPKMNPLAVSAAWHGVGRAAEISDASIAAGASRVTLAGAVDAAGVSLTTLKLSNGPDERLALAKAARVTWSPRFEVEALQLTGPEAALAVSMKAGASGQFQMDARKFQSVWLADFMALPGPEWRVESLEARGKWDGGPVAFSTKAEVALTLSPERAANVSLAAAGTAEGIKIESLRVLEGVTPIVDATGQLPLTLHPGTDRLVRLEQEAPLVLQATTTSNPEFWKKLAEATGLEFQDPEVRAAISGTWTHPKGDVSATATRVSVDPKRVKFSFPLVEALDLHATADGKGVNLDRLSLQIEKQAVSANGSVAFNFQQWGEFKRAPVAFLRRGGSGHLAIPGAEVSALAKFLPGFLAPAGRVEIDATLKPGGEMTGVFRLHDAATRPLGPLGALQEIQAEAQLNGRTVELKNLAARAGGQPVTLTGKIQLPAEGAPRYDLALRGENLPLVRQTGLLLRADLDLKLRTQGDGVPEVSGAVKLHDSMFLSDVRALIPRGGGGGPARRPPFFSVDVAPLNAWRLALEVSGERFLRLRSTVFVGVASAHFRLGGTLGDPRATGEALVDSGQVLLPFAAFRVEQGTVRLTEADPYDLRLFLIGTSRRYGYDLRMELTGTAAEPVLTFSSNPPLEAKQVLLMVTAGETPRDEVTYSGSQRATRLGTYLGQSLINNFGGDSTDADRLSISSGERVSRQGRETYDVEYRLTDRFTLVGEYDEFDDYNAGVKWRFLAPQNKLKKNATGATGATTPAKEKEAHDVPAR